MAITNYGTIQDFLDDINIRSLNYSLESIVTPNYFAVLTDARVKICKVYKL